MSVSAVQLAHETEHFHQNAMNAAHFSPQDDVVIDCNIDKIYYGQFLAVNDSRIPIEKGKITGFIGPSGCGKSTVLRSLNRMNDLIKSFMRLRLRNTVLLPQPDGPIKPVILPFSIGIRLLLTARN